MNHASNCRRYPGQLKAPLMNSVATCSKECADRQLLEAHDEIDELRERISELDAQVAQSVAENRKLESLFRTLAARDVHWAERAKAAEAVLRELAEYLRVFETSSRIVSGTLRTHEPDIRIVRDAATASDLWRMVQKHSVIHIDVETNQISKDPLRQTQWMKDVRLLCVGVGCSPDEPIYYIPADRWDIIERLVFQELRGKTFAGHNAKYDAGVLIRHVVWPRLGRVPSGELARLGVRSIRDPYLLHASQDQGKFGNGLKELCDRYLGIPDWSKEVWQTVEDTQKDFDLIHRSAMKDWKKHRTGPEPVRQTASFADVPEPVLVAYNGRDVLYEMLLWEHLEKSCHMGVYESLLVPMSMMLLEVECNGLGASARVHAALTRAYEDKIGQIDRAFHRQKDVRAVEAITGKPFNVNSWIDQVQLLEQTGLEVPDTTATGRPRLDKTALAELAKMDPSWRYLEALKSHTSMLSKFLDPLKAHIDEKDRIHTSYRIAKSESSSEDSMDIGGGTETGRLSSADPNLQNLKKDQNLRMMFTPRPGYRMVEVDYAQFEVRIMAWVSDCVNMREVFEAGVDPYKLNASKVWKYPRWQDVTKEHRTLAKVGTLAKIYRQHVEQFATRNGISMAEAEEFYAAFDREYPEFLAFQEDVIRQARSGEVVVTVTGRRRTFTYDGSSRDHHVDNEACNNMVQGPASDITCFKGHLLMRTPAVKEGSVIPVNLVHDSIWAEVRDDANFDRNVRSIVRVMTDPFLPIASIPLNVPLGVAVKVGPNLGKMKEYPIG